MDPSHPPAGSSVTMPPLAIASTSAAVPQDIELILQMVQGEMAELPRTVAGPVELAPGEGIGETATDSEASDGSSDDQDSDDDEESSSEAEGESNVKGKQVGSESSKPPISSLPASSSEPLTADRHATLLSQLTSFMAGADTLLNADGEGYITEDSDENLEEDDEEIMDADADESMEQADRFEEISDDEEIPGGPLVTANEIVEEPVKPPPIRRLPKGSEVILAGEVMSYMPDPAALRMQEEVDRERQAETNAENVEVQDLEAEKVAEVTADASKPVEGASVEADFGDVRMDDQEEGQSVETATVSTAEAFSVVKEGVEVLPPANVDANGVDEVDEEDLVDLEAGTASSTSDDDEPKPAAIDPPTAPTTTSPAKGKGKEKAKPKEPKISSGGKVVIRALRPPEGFHIGDRRVGDDEGWLEEGSLICFKDGTVVATIAETFGPLTSPFYLLRLPPPPFPIPSPSSLTPGTQLYYPSSANRSYVPVRLLRTDKRFKGSDASNRYDEEIGEEEREWSDDEEEMMAKRNEKMARKHGRDPNAAPSSASRPSRQPHFDYQNESAADSGLDYDGTGPSIPVNLPSRPNTGETSSPRGRGDRGVRGGERGARGGRGGDRGARGGRGGRGGLDGGSRGRGQGRPDRGGAVGRGFGRQADGRGRGHGLPSRSGGVPYPPPVSKPSEATINMAAERAARESAPKPPAPPAPLPARPAGPPPPPPPAVNPGQTGYNPQQPFHNAMPMPFQPWQAPQQGYMGGMVAPGAQFYGGMAQQMGAMNPYYQQQAMPYNAPYGYPAYPQQPNAGGAINPRFMGQQAASPQYPAAGPPQYPAAGSPQYPTAPSGGMPPQGGLQ